EILNLLVNNGFLGYDYEFQKYEAFQNIFSKYFEKQRYLARYNSEDFVITCAEGKKHLSYLIDSDSNDSRVIIKLTDQICKKVNKIIFSFIDGEGDSPANMQKSVSNIEINWLFKYNYFGMQYIEKYGRDFFENFPCENKEYITEGIIRINLVKDIFEEIDKNLKEKVREYLDHFSIPIKFYNHNKFLID
ncbi:hypothetical protein ACLI1A_14135, partial [Flavobacterium sp. RHBU_3]|uniref:hypothetical protein n=1 Tax=Flavobacterium sp. RHBU_3 TaxID=3391184 RepID=UPI0039848BC4